MQTITKNNLSCYLYDDAEVISIQADVTNIGDPLTLIIGDINLENGMLYKDVTAPIDWAGNKYLFDGVEWSANPDYKAPNTDE